MTRVVTCIIINDKDELLFLKRSNRVRTYKGLWGGIAGYIEENEEPLETALKEIKEESGLEKADVKFLKQIKPVKFTDFYEGETYNWEIYPFLFKIIKKSKIDIDWEHTEYKWITPSEIENMETVPHLKEVVFQIFGDKNGWGSRGGGEER